MSTFNGIGVALLGVRRMDEEHATARKWLTFLWLPIFPLGRRQVRLISAQPTTHRYIDLGPANDGVGDIPRTYLLGWIVFPVLLFSPLFIVIAEVWEALGLPEAWHRPAGFAAIGWFVVVVWILASVRERSLRPLSANP